MKTAIQELIDIIYERPTEISQFNATQLLKLIEPLLEKEKEQIKDAYNIGFKVSKDLGAINPSIDIADDYYNQAHNQNK